MFDDFGFFKLSTPKFISLLMLSTIAYKTYRYLIIAFIIFCGLFLKRKFQKKDIPFKTILLYLFLSLIAPLIIILSALTMLFIIFSS